MRTWFFFAVILTITLTVQSQKMPAQDADTTFISENLFIKAISENVYLHVSTAVSEQFGTYTANGLIYISGAEAVMMDTPPTVELSRALLSWFQKTFKDVKLTAVIVNHFHADCLGGLSVFHEAGSTSYAHRLTPELLKPIKNSFVIPQNVFSGTLSVKIGKSRVVNYYFGEAHTRDNIVTWIPDEKILFGGCMVKSVNAGKGNLADANTGEWSNTIRNVKKKFPDLKIVIPGHGNAGGIELLDFTISLFEKK